MNIFGSGPFVVKYDMRGMDGPSRYMVVNADDEFLAEFGGRHVQRETREQDESKNEQSRQRAQAFCDWLNGKQVENVA